MNFGTDLELRREEGRPFRFSSPTVLRQASGSYHGALLMHFREDLAQSSSACLDFTDIYFMVRFAPNVSQQSYVHLAYA